MLGRALEGPECGGGDDAPSVSHEDHADDDDGRADEQHPRAQAQRPARPGLQNVHGLRSLKTSPSLRTIDSIQRMGRIGWRMRQG